MQFVATLTAARVAAASDATLETGYLEYGGSRCYVARPRAALEKAPTLVVLHGERGFDARIEELARRGAAAGFAAIAPDLSLDGGDADQRRANLLALLDDLAARPESGALGAVGFSSGGTAALELAARSTKLVAVTAFYAPVPPVLEVPRLKARVLLHLAENDREINTAVPAYEAALNAAGVPNAIHIYSGAAHGFYDEDGEAAALAWNRTLAFFKDALQ